MAGKERTKIWEHNNCIHFMHGLHMYVFVCLCLLLFGGPNSWLDWFVVTLQLSLILWVHYYFSFRRVMCQWLDDWYLFVATAADTCYCCCCCCCRMFLFNTNKANSTTTHSNYSLSRRRWWWWRPTNQPTIIATPATTQKENGTWRAKQKQNIQGFLTTTTTTARTDDDNVNTWGEQNK